ncbi:hypothetical protein Ndes2526B_g01042 [Nannochloris sp. 'desiccata']
MLEHGSKLAWPCHVACWLPTPITKTEKPSTLLVAAASKASAPGNWLISASKNGEVISIDVVRDAPPLLKILCEGGRSLVSTPLSPHAFSFALVREVLLVASVINPSGGSAYTFGCQFMCHQQAVECAAVMKAAISLATPKTTKLQAPSLPANIQTHAFSLTRQQRAELLLLETVARGDPKGAGAAWWQDFPQLVEELDQNWRRIKSQQPAAF